MFADPKCIKTSQEFLRYLSHKIKAEISQANYHHQKENKEFTSYVALSNNRSFRTFYNKA